MEKFLTGNVSELASQYRGWVMGHFVEPASPLCTEDVEVKWGEHKKGETKNAVGANQQAKTLAILIFGKWLIKLPEIPKDIVLEKQGDYLLFEPGVAHSWEALEDSLVLTIRWPSLPNDQQTTTASS